MHSRRESPAFVHDYRARFSAERQSARDVSTGPICHRAHDARGSLGGAPLLALSPTRAEHIAIPRLCADPRWRLRRDTWPDGRRHDARSRRSQRQFVLPAQPEHDLLLIASGTGISPFFAMHGNLVDWVQRGGSRFCSVLVGAMTCYSTMLGVPWKRAPPKAIFATCRSSAAPKPKTAGADRPVMPNRASTSSIRSSRPPPAPTSAVTTRWSSSSERYWPRVASPKTRSFITRQTN
jgi:hypothetical protein